MGCVTEVAPDRARSHAERTPTPLRNPRNRPMCPWCGCPDLCGDTTRCDCVLHDDCSYGWIE